MSETGGARISELGTHTFVSRASIAALGALASILIARALGPDGRGRYILPTTAVLIAYQVASLGTPPAQFRLWSRRAAPPPAFVTSGILLSVLPGLVVATLTWLIYLVGRRDVFAAVQPQDMLLALIIVPFMVHGLFAAGLLILNRRLLRVNTSAMAGALIQTVGLLVLFLAGAISVESVIVLWGLSFIVPWALMLPGILRVGRPALPIPSQLVAEHLRLGMSFLPWMLFMYLNLRLDVFFVARYADVGQVGIYSVAVIFAEATWLVTDSLGNAISERQANAPEGEAATLTLSGCRMAIVLAAVVGSGIGVMAQVLIGLLYGRAFAPAEPVVWILIPAVSAMALWKLVAPLLIRIANPSALSLISVSSILANVVGNVALVPRWGIVGAAVASLISYGIGAILSTSLVLRRHQMTPRALLPGRFEFTRLVTALRPSEIRRAFPTLLKR